MKSFRLTDKNTITPPGWGLYLMHPLDHQQGRPKIPSCSYSNLSGSINHICLVQVEEEVEMMYNDSMGRDNIQHKSAHILISLYILSLASL